MACSPPYRVRTGKQFERELTALFVENGFDATHCGRVGDGGVDVRLRLFDGEITVQCHRIAPATFSFSNLFADFRRAKVAVFNIKGLYYPEPVVMVPLSVWLADLRFKY